MSYHLDADIATPCFNYALKDLLRGTVNKKPTVKMSVPSFRALLTKAADWNI